MCVITLVEFRGITAPGGPVFSGPGIPPFLRVSGTITGCPPQSAGSLPTVSIATSCTGEVHGVSVTAAGTWVHEFPNPEHCACDSLSSVTVTCDNDPTCTRIFTSVKLQCDERITPPECCDEVTLVRDTDPLPCIPAGGGPVSV